MIRRHVLVMAKSPVPGRVKTRMCPPLSAIGAAELAEAALADTLEAVAECGAERRLVAVDGDPGPWLPAGFEVFHQSGRGLDERLAAAWAQAGGPGLQIGMDTPQITSHLLDSSLDELSSPRTTAVLGPAFDGGWWGIGLSSPDPAAFLGVPMSTRSTGHLQLRRLVDLGHDPVILPVLRDVDYVEDARFVADLVPSSCFARVLRSLLVTVGGA